MELKIFTAYTSFTHLGGAEKVALQIHEEYKKRGFKSYIMASNKFENLNPLYNINKEEYIRFEFQSIFKLRNSIVLSHHRKITTCLVLLNRFFKLNIRIIHIAHNEFFNLKYFTLFPKEVIAVSEKVKFNLVNYFDVSESNVKVIYNGVKADYTSATMSPSSENDRIIKILYPARITKIKNQVGVVSYLKDKMPENIVVYFAGIGEEMNELEQLISNSKQFVSLGYVDLNRRLSEFDYVMLYSLVEGLPLSLIEACSVGIPIICNNVGGNSEIVNNKFNGYVVESDDLLLECLRNIPLKNSEEYIRLSNNAKRVYEEKFTDKKMLNNYVNYILN